MLHYCALSGGPTTLIQQNAVYCGCQYSFVDQLPLQQHLDECRNRDRKPMASRPSNEHLIAFAHQLADAAGDVIRPHFRDIKAVENKLDDGFDPVTKADKDAETAMRAMIEATYPDHGILGEEHGTKAAGPGGLTWVLDPIDGTRSFIGGFPTWGTLIALNAGAAPFIGIMDQPFTGERFLGTPDGAFLGDQKLSVRSCASIDEAVLYSTTPDMFHQPGEMAAFQRVEEVVKLRRFGGDCYAYAMMALGFVDVIVEAAMQPYDIQALIPIVEGAGGYVCNWDGDPADQGGQVLAAGDKRVLDQALALLQG
jgi:histidinol phosphatase-like enzyme (inositol monophosphatase family)